MLTRRSQENSSLCHGDIVYPSYRDSKSKTFFSRCSREHEEDLQEIVKEDKRPIYKTDYNTFMKPLPTYLRVFNCAKLKNSFLSRWQCIFANVLIYVSVVPSASYIVIPTKGGGKLRQQNPEDFVFNG